VLNRLYIVVGLLAILVIGGAFVVPLFVDWSDYRGRMEALATEAMGTKVSINGEIDFNLLPQPRLSFDTVVVGTDAEPLIEVASAEAEFSLMDFLRDRYSVTRLVLNEPHLHLQIDENGRFSTPLNLPETVTTSNISIADAEINNGIVQLTDARSGETWQATDFAGTLQIAGLQGPFSLQGDGRFDGETYGLRFSTSAMNAADEMQVNTFIKPQGGQFSAVLEGLFQTGTQPDFSGTFVFRQAPSSSSSADEVRGDLVLTSEVEVNPEQILFTNYVVEPDENRPATRLTGTAVLLLGAAPQFDAVISGGVVALTPRDALEEEEVSSFELVRLLNELPAPIMPPIAGRIGVDVSEFNMRAFSLRELRVDARTDGQSWTIDNLTARMPGDTTLSVAGKLAPGADKPVFDGNLSLASGRLDALALLWRRPGEGNALFNMPGSLAGKVRFADDTLSFGKGVFLLDGVRNEVALDLKLGAEPRLESAIKLGAISARQSKALLELLPGLGANSSFDVTFASGAFDLTADTATLFDLPASGITIAGGWNRNSIVFDRLGIAEIGGARVDIAGAMDKTHTVPILSGQGQLSLSGGAKKGALATLLEVANVSEPIRDWLYSSLPAELGVELSLPDAANVQLLTLHGRAGVAEVEASLTMAEGPFYLSSAPLRAELSLISGQPEALSKQLGLGDIALVPDDGPMQLAAVIDGTPTNSLGVDLSIEGSGDVTRFAGNVIVSDPSELRGKGKLEFEVSDVSPFLELVGAEGIGYVPASGAADFGFVGTRNLSLSAIDAEIQGAFLSGELNRSVQAGEVLVTGALRSSAIELGGLATLVGGPSAMLSGPGLWPDGPFTLSDGARGSRGRVRIDTPFVRSNGVDIASDAGFDLTWDESNLKVRGFEALLGGGRLGLDFGICCTGSQPERQVTGRLTLSGVNVDALLPDVPADVVDGVLDGGAVFSGTGASFAAILDSLAGEGSFSISDLTVQQFAPSAFGTVAGVENVLELEADVLTNILEEALLEGVFSASQTGGVFTLAGGTIRVSNLAAEGDGGRLFGGMQLSLSDLGIDGRWTLTPKGVVDPSGLINERNARATAVISGTLVAPEHELDLTQMIDGIKVRAYELEVDRLEKLRAEDEARARAAAEERARLMEEHARKLAQEELAKAAAEDLTNEEAERLQALENPLPLEEEAPIDLIQNPFAPAAPEFTDGTTVFQPSDVTGDALTDAFN